MIHRISNIKSFLAFIAAQHFIDHASSNLFRHDANAFSGWETLNCTHVRLSTYCRSIFCCSWLVLSLSVWHQCVFRSRNFELYPSQTQLSENKIEGRRWTTIVVAVMLTLWRLYTWSIYDKNHYVRHWFLTTPDALTLKNEPHAVHPLKRIQRFLQQHFFTGRPKPNNCRSS